MQHCCNVAVNYVMFCIIVNCNTVAYMLDHLRIAIPFQKQFIKSISDSRSELINDVTCFGVPAACRTLWRDLDTGDVKHGELYHCFESLKSSFSTMAMKVYHIGVNTVPRAQPS